MTAVSDTIDPWIFRETLVVGVLLLAALVWLWSGVRRSQRAGTPGWAQVLTRPRFVTIRRRVREA